MSVNPGARSSRIHGRDSSINLSKASPDNSGPICLKVSTVIVLSERVSKPILAYVKILHEFH